MTPNTLVLDLSPTEARRLRWRTSTADLAHLESLHLPLWVAGTWDHWDQGPVPLGGLAGACDQRLGGTLGRQTKEGRLSLARGEVALVGTAERLAGAHLLLMGLGAAGSMVPSAATALGQESAERIHKLGTGQYALEPPWSDQVPGPEASRSAADFVVAHLRWRLAVLGPPGASGVTLVLPENVRLAEYSRSPGAGLRTRRRQQSRRSVFFRRRRK